MMKAIKLTVLIILIFFSRCSNSRNNQQNAIGSSQYKGPDPVAAIHGQDPEGTDCIFDTSTYKFTTDKLRQYKKDTQFTWNDMEKEAIVRLDNEDTLRLHIGGCNHFAYSAVYITDGTKFQDDSFLLDKAKWLSVAFLGDGFDKTYKDCIEQGLYNFDSAGAKTKSLTIVDKDTPLTNKVYEPILFETDGQRTRISVAGFIN